MIDEYALDSRLARIRVVLVETSHPGNIGAVARAMKNMGLSQLVLVNPKEFPSQVASARASSACDLLNRAKVVESLPEALIGAQVVFGASARLRKVAWPQCDVRETAALSLQALSADQEAQVALVFGREDSGLSNAELDLCHYLAHIPSNPSYSSLNISAAVQVFAYECLMATQFTPLSSQGYRHALASSDQLEGFYQHLLQALQQVGFVDPAKNARFMRRMRRLFNRAALDIKEIDILRGILTATQRKLAQVRSSKDER
ncbi:MAG: RNA methyltransferase [Thiotrichales bacterium]|nr:RNA methyltransferase [Thiotrichales bacterium]